jgi:hypothetical protein
MFFTMGLKWKTKFLTSDKFFITTSYKGDTIFLEGSISKEGIIHENNFVKLILVKSELNVKKKLYLDTIQ